MEEGLTRMADAALRRFIDTGAIVRAAGAFARVMDQSAQFGRVFGDLTPWRVTLVDTCLCKLIGTPDDPDLALRKVAASAADQRAQADPTLIAHPGDTAWLHAVRAAHPDRFAAFVTQIADRDMPPGQLRPRSGGGLVEIDLSAQLDRLIEMIDAADALHADRSGRPDDPSTDGHRRSMKMLSRQRP